MGQGAPAGTQMNTLAKTLRTGLTKTGRCVPAQRGSGTTRTRTMSFFLWLLLAILAVALIYLAYRFSLERNLGKLSEEADSEDIRKHSAEIQNQIAQGKGHL